MPVMMPVPEDDWVDVDDWKDEPIGSRRPPLTAGAGERYLSGAVTEPLGAVGEGLSAAKDYFVKDAAKFDPASGEMPDMLIPGMPAAKLLKTIFEGLQQGAEGRFTKMFEQYDRGSNAAVNRGEGTLGQINSGLNDRGPDGTSLSPVGQAIAGAAPGVGPLAADITERGTGGDVAGAAGQLTTAVATGEALRKLLQAPPRMQGGTGKYAKEAAAKQAERDAIQARNAEDTFLKGEQRAAQIKEYERLKKMRQENIPTDVQAVNEAAGVKAADVGKRPENMRDPARGAMRTGIVDPENPGTPADLYAKSKAKLGELQKEKNKLLNQPGVTVARKEVSNVADSLQDIIDEAKVTDPRAVPHIERVQDALRGLVEDRTVAGAGGKSTLVKATFGQDLTLAQLSKVIKRLDNEIRDIPDKALKTAVGKQVGAARKALGDILDAKAPGVSKLDTDMKDVIGYKSASGRKLIAERAEGAPTPKKVPEDPALPPDMQARVEIPPDPIALKEAEAAKAAGRPLTPEQEVMLRGAVGLGLRASGASSIPFANWALMRYFTEKLGGR